MEGQIEVGADRRWILGRQWHIFRRWLPAIIVIVVAVALPVYAFLSVQPAVYQASTTQRVGGSPTRLPDYNSILASAELSKYYAYLATTRPLLTVVKGDLGLPQSVDELSRQVSAATGVNGTLLTITVRDRDPEQAAAIADGVARALIATTPVSSDGEIVTDSLTHDLATIRADIDATEAEIAALEAVDRPSNAQRSQLAGSRARLLNLVSTHATVLQLALASDANDITVVTPAFTLPDPIEPRPFFFTLLAAFVTFFAASAIVFIAEYFKDDVKDAEDIEEVTSLAVVGAVTHPSGAFKRDPSSLVTVHRPGSSAAESYRKLRVNIDLLSAHGEFRTLLVTGPKPAAATTLTAANLAVAFAQSGRGVILVDADMRDPHLHELFDVPNERGLAQLLAHGPPAVDWYVQPTPVANLRIITAGGTPPNPADLIGTEAMREAVLRLVALADLVILNSPPVPAHSDAILLSSYIQETVLVVSPRRTRRDELLHARQALEIAQANLVGAVAFGISRGLPLLGWRRRFAYEPRGQTQPMSQSASSSAPNQPGPR
jgi:capsular exopolysaccharide synthesis family protein